VKRKFTAALVVRNLDFTDLVFRWAITVVLDMTTISRQEKSDTTSTYIIY
jgi:hypothetical protein